MMKSILYNSYQKCFSRAWRNYSRVRLRPTRAIYVPHIQNFVMHRKKATFDTCDKIYYLGLTCQNEVLTRSVGSSTISNHQRVETDGNDMPYLMTNTTSCTRRKNTNIHVSLKMVIRNYTRTMAVAVICYNKLFRHNCWPEKRHKRAIHPIQDVQFFI